MDDIKFASLMCSKLCHDLVSPVGAMANGVEILAEEQDPEMVEQVVSLLGQSAAQTSARLQFFRLAFGAAGGFGAQLDTREAEKVVRGLFAGGKIDVEWAVPPDPLPKDIVKLLLNLALICGEGLVRGGQLALKVDGEGANLQLEVTATGDRVIIQESLIQALTGDLDEAEIEPRTTPAFLCVKLLAAMDGSLVISRKDDTGISITASIDGSSA